MPTPYLCADLHLGHKNIHKYRGFPTQEAHFNFMRDNWYVTVGPKDIVYVLGDVCFDAEHWELFAQWPGRKIVILGNHCTERNKHTHIPSSIELHGAMAYKGMWLTHIPIHPEFLRGKLNVHGHLHDLTVNDPRYLCVSMEQIGNVPISLEEVRQEFIRRRSFKYNLHKFGLIQASRTYVRQWRKRHE